MIGFMLITKSISRVMIFIWVIVNIDEIIEKKEKMDNLSITSSLLDYLGLLVACSILIYMFWCYALSVHEVSNAGNN